MRFFLFLFILGLSATLIGQDYSSFECDVTINGKELAYPFTGGFDAPQFSQGDFNQDGILDLFVFDRRGDVSMMFEYSGDGLSRGYSFTRENKENIPSTLVSYAKMRDYNGDGLADFFAGPLGTAIALHEAYLAQDGTIKYRLRRMGKSEGDFEYVYFQNSVRQFNIPIPPSDIPDIIDVDNDGDLDILSFDQNGTFVTFYENRQMDKNLPSDTMDFALIPNLPPALRVGDRCFGKFREATLDATIILSSSPDDCSTGLTEPNENEGKSGPHAGSTLMAFDNDNDGDLELLIGDLNTSSLVFLENGGSTDNAWMVSATDSFPMYDRSSITPQFAASYLVDVDNDGLSDIITSVNNPNKTLNVNNINFYKNTGDANEPFRFIQNDFLTEETIDLGSFTAPIFLDENADGLMDILVGTGGFYNDMGRSDFFLALFRNVGTATAPSFVLVDEDYLNFSAFRGVFANNPAPAIGDLDSDGDEDLLIGLEGVIYYFENTAGPDQPMQFAAPDFGGALDVGYMEIKGGIGSKLDLADVNNDGLTDIIVGELNLNANNGSSGPIFGNVAYYQNIGTVGAPFFNPDLSQEPNNPALGGMNSKLFVDNAVTVAAAPHFFTLQDQLQVLIGSEDGRIKRYRVDPTDLEGPYTPIDSIVGGILEGQKTALSLADIDDDGFMEMVVGNGRGGLSMFNTDIESNASSTTDIADDGVSLFPNPTKDHVNIKIDEPIIIQSITLYSAEGQLIKSLKSDQREVSLAELSVGIYFMKIVTTEGEISEKIVKL